ncbi:MAG: hypothetical protein Q3966_00725 [Neisseria sp.]|nr:hypothetical protein [Neisseria sp.]
MKYIPTSQDIINRIRSRAETEPGGLDGAAAAFGYEDFTQAEACLNAGLRLGLTPLTEECLTLCGHVGRGEDYITATGFDTETVSAFLLFNTDRRDAWLYDVFGRNALCLMLNGKECPVRPIRYENHRFDIEWDGTVDQTVSIYSLTDMSGAAKAKLGSGYIFPEYITLLIEDLGKRAARQAHDFFKNGTEELTAEVISRLQDGGWTRQDLEQAAAKGGRYLAEGNRIIYPNPAFQAL